MKAKGGYDEQFDTWQAFRTDGRTSITWPETEENDAQVERPLVGGGLGECLVKAWSLLCECFAGYALYTYFSPFLAFTLSHYGRKSLIFSTKRCEGLDFQVFTLPPDFTCRCEGFET